MQPKIKNPLFLILAITLLVSASFSTSAVNADLLPAPLQQPLSDRGISNLTQSSLPQDGEDLLDVAVLINEVMFKPADGGHEWVELKNVSTGDVPISQYALTDEDGNWFFFPHDTPPMPPGAFVLVNLDGLGSTANDLDFSDNLVTLHSQAGSVNWLEDDFDQLAIYTDFFHVYLPLVMGESEALPGNVRSADIPLGAGLATFVAWGAPAGEDALAAVAQGLWSENWYVNLETGKGILTGNVPQGLSIGLLPGSVFGALNEWDIYQASQTNPGEENDIPLISWVYPEDGAYVDSERFIIQWNAIDQALGYLIQIDDQADFSSPIVEQSVSEPAIHIETWLPGGVYYWRVKVTFAEQESTWSEVHQLETVDYVIRTAGIEQTGRDVNIAWQRQQKDTPMLCLDGDPRLGPAAWNIPHSQTGEHGNMYCARAALAMMASYYGSNLTQDRISYEIFKGEGPEGDLGHNIGVNLEQIDQAINWALGQSIIRVNEKPTYEQIKTWIDNNQPVYTVTQSHARLIVGYREVNLGLIKLQWVNLLDPALNLVYPGYYPSEPIIAAWVGPSGPSGAPGVRMEEDENSNGVRDTFEDTDGDGIVDFDERYRFHTDDIKRDSDADGISDATDLAETLFDSAGKFRLPVRSDFDRDNLRKELDPDNDNDGGLDGCEDDNRNGIYEPGLDETSNFDPMQTIICQITPEGMVSIPEGEFMMGCDPSHNGGYACGSAEVPLHAVYLDQYYMDLYEVTNADYALCVAAGGCNAPSSNASATHVDYYGNPAFDNYPVVYVNWHDANNYCTWAGKQLPTEAQWEKAARGTQVVAFPWGDSSPSCSLANTGNNLTNTLCYGDTTPVGSFPAGVSEYGVFDMAGNVAEWVADWALASYYSTSPYLNPTGPLNGTEKIMRGGTFYQYWSYQRTALRYFSSPYSVIWQIGFRCADTTP